MNEKQEPEPPKTAAPKTGGAKDAVGDKAAQQSSEARPAPPSLPKAGPAGAPQRGHDTAAAPSNGSEYYIDDYSSPSHDNYGSEAYDDVDYEPLPKLNRQTASRRLGQIDEKSVHRLIDVKSNLSTIELTLTAITVAVIVLKIAFSELATQIGSAVSGGTARSVLDVSIAVGFIAIVLASLQIPRHFTDALIHSNQDTMRILQMVGATPRFVARCFSRLVLASMWKAAWKGLLVAAVLYLVISEFAQLWVPVTRTYFLRDLAEAAVGIGVFMLVMQFLLQRKVVKFYEKFRR